MKKTRDEIRNERAEIVCREVRYQMGKYGGIKDNNTLSDYLLKWMDVAKKNKHECP